MKKATLIIGLIGIGLFLFGSLGISQAIKINLSSGPSAEGQQAIQSAQADNSRILANDQLKNNDQARQQDQTVFDGSKEATIQKIIILQWALGISGALAIFIGLLGLAINFTAFVTIRNIRSLVSPIRTDGQNGWFAMMNIFNPTAMFVGNVQNPHGGFHLEKGESPQLLEGNATPTGLKAAAWSTIGKKSATKADIPFATNEDQPSSYFLQTK